MLVYRDTIRVEPDDDGRLRLECWVPYVLETETPVDLPGALGADPLPRGDGEPFRWRINFGDYVGRLVLDGIDILVSSKKLDEDGFDALLRSITSRVAELPFDFSTPTFVPFAREALGGRDLLYHAFLYLRWAFAYASPSLGEIWAAVSAAPHLQLVREERVTPLWEARSVSPRMLERIATDSSNWVPVGGEPLLAANSLARALTVGGVPHLPAHVTEPCVKSCLDTAENRFAKYFVGLALDLVEQARDLLAERLCDASLQAQAAELANRLREMASADWLEEVGDFDRFPAHSQVMQKRFGYRDVLRHYLALVLASRYPLAAAAITRIVETKSASLLYEYWTFFELAESLGDLLGDPIEAVRTTESDPFSSVLKEGIRLTFPPVGGAAFAMATSGAHGTGAPGTASGRAVELWYNRSFSRSAPVGARSYSVALRPDICLRVGDRLHLFDAKFRVDQFEIPDDAVAAEDEAEARGTVTKGWFKHADIHKMHAYKDAIGGADGRVASVWVLYPGSEFRFFGEDGTRWESAEALARAVSTTELRGVGAVPMVPGEELQRSGALSAMLRAVVDEGGAACSAR